MLVRPSKIFVWGACICYKANVWLLACTLRVWLFCMHVCLCLYAHPCNVVTKQTFGCSHACLCLYAHHCNMVPNKTSEDLSSRSSAHLYAPQTKGFEERTKGRACIFEVLCDGSSPKKSTHTLSKYLENTRPTFCSISENLRLGSIILRVFCLFLQAHPCNFTLPNEDFGRLNQHFIRATCN